MALLVATQGWAGTLATMAWFFTKAALAACVLTFFTFLPSFIFILAGGPLLEATHGRLGFTAPRTAITAAVVGVILNLALFFAWPTLWSGAVAGRLGRPR